MRILMQAGSAASELSYDRWSHAIIGCAVDDRGRAAEGFARKEADSVHLFSYNPETLSIRLDGDTFSAEGADEALSKMAKGRILVETTTLGFVEILLCCRALKQL